MSCTFVLVSLESCCVLYVGDFGSIFGAPLFRLPFDAIQVEMNFADIFDNETRSKVVEVFSGFQL